MEIVEQLALLYRNQVEDAASTAFDLQHRVIALFGSFGIELTASGLDELVLVADEIVERNGPIEAATSTVSAVLGVSPRAVYNWRKDEPHAVPPVAFGVRVGEPGLLRYALGLFGFPKRDVDDVMLRFLRNRREQSPGP